ncbi:MAG: hypothetical protein ACTSRH_01790 [Promethearchaeota archaeon]
MEDSIKRFRINEYLELRLESGQTKLYVNGEYFLTCLKLVVKFPINPRKDIDSIDDLSEFEEYYYLSPEEEFKGHCSNLQVWAEYDYDPRLLHSNLSFPLLKKLAEIGDPKAKKVLSKEIKERFKKGENLSIFYEEKYFDLMLQRDKEDLIKDILIKENSENKRKDDKYYLQIYELLSSFINDKRIKSDYKLMFLKEIQDDIKKLMMDKTCCEKFLAAIVYPFLLDLASFFFKKRDIIKINSLGIKLLGCKRIFSIKPPRNDDIFELLIGGATVKIPLLLNRIKSSSKEKTSWLNIHSFLCLLERVEIDRKRKSFSFRLMQKDDNEIEVFEIPLFSRKIIKYKNILIEGLLNIQTGNIRNYFLIVKNDIIKKHDLCTICLILMPLLTFYWLIHGYGIIFLDFMDIEMLVQTKFPAEGNLIMNILFPNQDDFVDLPFNEHESWLKELLEINSEKKIDFWNEIDKLIIMMNILDFKALSHFREEILALFLANSPFKKKFSEEKWNENIQRHQSNQHKTGIFGDSLNTWDDFQFNETVDVDTILRMINNDDESIENIQDDDSDSLDLSYKIDELINKPFLNKEKIDISYFNPDHEEMEFNEDIFDEEKKNKKNYSKKSFLNGLFDLNGNDFNS